MLGHSTLLLLAGLLTVIALLWVASIAYNIFFHPLSAFPGPSSAAASHLPQFIARGKGDIKYVEALHRKYGSVVRLAPNELSFTSAQAWRDIYAHKQGQKQLPKQIVLDSPDLVLKAPHLILAPDEAHARMRRNLSHAFSSSAIYEQESLLEKHFDKMIERIKEQSADGAVDMEKLYNCVAFDVIGDLAFGQDFGALERYEYHEYMVGVFRSLKVFSMFQRLSAYQWLLRPVAMLMPTIPAAVKARTNHFKFAAMRVQERMARQTDRKDFMWYILRHNEKAGRGLSQDEIYSNAGLLIGAGSETTATTLSGATYLLLRHPEALQKLTDEVRGRFTSAQDISIATASQLPYLTAVLDEAMRLYPPGPAANVRVVLENMVIDGRPVAKGTRVAVQQWTSHHSELNFHNAHKFIPERWLGDKDEYKSDSRGAFNPFSVGPRNCLGKSLAYAEMVSIMARLIFAFDMELVHEQEDWLDQRVFIFWEKKLLWVKMVPSQRSDLRTAV